MLKTKEEVENWLKEMKINGYTIHDDLTVDVAYGVNLKEKGLTEIPIQFGVVNGRFLCQTNKLKSLKGCPKKVVGNFNCSNNQLINLDFCPEIGEEAGFKCSNNQLTSLKGCPPKVKDFECSYNLLTSLEFGPIECKNFYFCNNNQLTSLKGVPERLEGSFYCFNNELISLEYGPKYVGGSYNCSKNKIKSLLNGPQYVGNTLDCNVNQLSNLENNFTDLPQRVYIDNNLLTSLKGLENKSLESLSVIDNQITSLKYCPIVTDELRIARNPIENYETPEIMVKNRIIISYKKEEKIELFEKYYGTIILEDGSKDDALKIKYEIFIDYERKRILSNKLQKELEHLEIKAKHKI